MRSFSNLDGHVPICKSSCSRGDRARVHEKHRTCSKALRTRLWFLFYRFTIRFSNLISSTVYSAWTSLLMITSLYQIWHLISQSLYTLHYTLRQSLKLISRAEQCCIESMVFPCDKLMHLSILSSRSHNETNIYLFRTMCSWRPETCFKLFVFMLP